MNKKFTKLIAALALLTFLAVPMGMRGQTTNFTLSSASSVTQNGITVSFATSSGSNAPTWYAAGLRLYANNTVTISSTNTITEILFNWEKQGSKEFASATANVGNYTHPSTTGTGTWSGSANEVVFTLGNSGQLQLNTFSVTVGGSTDVATTTTIDASGITNTDANNSTAAGSLSATVSANNTPIEGATVTWSGNNDDVATIDSDGVVTLVGAGTVTFTAAYAGVSGTYQPSSDTYQMTVTYQPTTIEITPNYTFWGKTAAFSGTTNQSLSGSKDNVILSWSGGGGNTYANSSAMRFYPKNTLTFTAPTGYEIKSIEFTATYSTITSNSLSFSPTGFDGTNNTWTGASGTVTMSGPSSVSGYAQFSKIIITIGLPKNVARPTFSLASGSYAGTQNVTISCETSGATIYYTTDGTTPSANNGTQGTSVSIEETTTLKAIAIKGNDDSDVALAIYTILIPFTTMQQICNDASTNITEHTVAITFNNWVISGVNGTGSGQTNAFLTDGTYGCVIYKNGSTNLGFARGDILSGTVICKLSRYASTQSFYAQLSDFTSATDGLNITTGGSVTPVVTTIDALSAQNVGSVVTIKDVTYSESGSYKIFTDASNNQIYYFNTLFSTTFNSGSTYDITGVFNQGYTTVKRILPREPGDVLLKANLDIDYSTTPFSYIVNEGPSAEQNIDVICTDLGTNTLTATASSDYEVSLAYDETYTQSVELTPEDGEVYETVYVRLKSGLSVGDYNGTVTFTADNLTTQNVALEGLVSGSQTYAIILTQPDEATIAADKAIAEAGEIVTLSYSGVVDCYEFTGWTVLKDDLETEVTVTNNQFTMPDCDVLVGATFTKKTFVVSFSVNGIVYDALDITGIECGNSTTLWDADDLEDESITMPTGYTFTGWSTAAGSSETVSSFTPTENATLYAVMVPENAFTYVKVTRLQDITAGEYFIVNDGYVLPNQDATNKCPVKNENYEITTPLSDSYETLPVAGTAWTFTGTNEAMTVTSNATGHYLFVSGNDNDKLRVGETSDTWSFAVNGTGFSMKDSSKSRYCATYEAGSDWRSYNSATAVNYGDNGILYLYKKSTPASYTRIENITSPETLPSIEPTYLITVQDGGVLTLTGPNNGDASNLIIEDGGQLICNNDVTATLQKDITAAGNWGEQDPDNPYTADGWYFIASPVNGFSTSTIATGITTSDLYSYNESTCQWFNAQGSVHPFTTLTRGHGYLYANFTGDDLSFAGAMPATNTNIEMDLSYAYDGNLKGFNLMGNPFTCNLTSDNVKIQKGETMTDITSYYIVENGTELAQMTLSTNPIKPGRGFLIQADGEGQKLVFNPGAKRGETTNKPSFINIEAGNANFMDRACVQIGSGNTLRKMTINDNVSHVYVMHDGKDYAAATITEAQGEMPVSFRANENGQYTLTVNPENVDMNYLHLIDNMTGMDVDLLQTPNYTFNANVTDYESRFKLVFASNNEDGASTGSAAFAFYSNGNWIINNVGEATLQVVDLTGRILSSETVNGSVSTTINATPGVYMLRLINGENVNVQKIVVR